MIRRTFLQLGSLVLSPFVAKARAGPAHLDPLFFRPPRWATGEPLRVVLHIENSEPVRNLCGPLFRLLSEVGDLHPSSTGSVVAVGPLGSARMSCELRELPPRGWIGQAGDSRWLNRGGFSAMLGQDLDEFTIGRFGHTKKTELATRPQHGVHIMVFRRDCEPEKAEGRKHIFTWNPDPDSWGEGYVQDVRQAIERVADRTRAGYQFHQLIAILDETDDDGVDALQAIGLPGRSLVTRIASSDDLIRAFHRLDD